MEYVDIILQETVVVSQTVGCFLRLVRKVLYVLINTSCDKKTCKTDFHVECDL